MKKKILLSFLLITVFAGLAAVWTRRDFIEKILLEKYLNAGAHEYFDGSLRLRDGGLKNGFRLYIKGLTGDLQTENGRVPVSLENLESTDSILNLLSGRKTGFVFSEARAAGSKYGGIQGRAEFTGGKTWLFEMKAEVEGIGLEDLSGFNPASLKGSTGRMKGRLYVRSGEGVEPSMDLHLEVPSPGGKLQARFFDLLLPYLPDSVGKGRVSQVVSSENLVSYERALVEVTQPSADAMKILLKILVPEYNLDLNLNLEIRIEEETSFLELAELMGIVRISQT